jgi:hypothetical protein
MTALVLPLESEGCASLKSLAHEAWVRKNVLFVDACHRIQILTNNTNENFSMRIQREEKLAEYHFYYQNVSDLNPKLLQKTRMALDTIEAFANPGDQLGDSGNISETSCNRLNFQSGLVGVKAQQRFKSIHDHYSKLQKSLKG